MIAGLSALGDGDDHVQGQEGEPHDPEDAHDVRPAGLHLHCARCVFVCRARQASCTLASISLALLPRHQAWSGPRSTGRCRMLRESPPLGACLPAAVHAAACNQQQRIPGKAPAVLPKNSPEGRDSPPCSLAGHLALQTRHTDTGPCNVQGRTRRRQGGLGLQAARAAAACRGGAERQNEARAGVGGSEQRSGDLLHVCRSEPPKVGQVGQQRPPGACQRRKLAQRARHARIGAHHLVQARTRSLRARAARVGHFGPELCVCVPVLAATSIPCSPFKHKRPGSDAAPCRSARARVPTLAPRQSAGPAC